MKEEDLLDKKRKLSERLCEVQTGLACHRDTAGLTRDELRERAKVRKKLIIEKNGLEVQLTKLKETIKLYNKKNDVEYSRTVKKTAAKLMREVLALLSKYRVSDLMSMEDKDTLLDIMSRTTEFVMETE